MISGLHAHKQYNYTGLIELLKVLPATAEQELEKREMLVIILKFGYNLHIGDLKYCVTLLPQIQTLLDTKAIKVLTHYQQIYLYHQLAVYYFLIKDFEKASDWLQEGQNHEKYGFFMPFRHFGRLMQVLAYYEQGNYSLLESKLRSIEHYIKVEGRLDETEEDILKYIKETLRVKNRKEEKKLLEKLRRTIDNNAKNNMELTLKSRIINHWLGREKYSPQFVDSSFINEL